MNSGAQVATLSFLPRNEVGESLSTPAHSLVGNRKRADMTTFRPIGNNFLAKPIKPDRGNSLLHIPESVQEQATTWEVVAVGPGEKIDPSIKVGSRVHAPFYSGQDIAIDGVPHKLFNANAPLAVYE